MVTSATLPALVQAEDAPGDFLPAAVPPPDDAAIASRERETLLESVSRQMRQLAAEFADGDISDAEFIASYAALGSQLHGLSHDGPPEDCLLTALDQRRFGLIDPPEKPEPLFLIERNIIATAGNLVVIAAQAKTGKSAYLGAMMAAALNPRADAADTLGIRSCGAGERAVIHFDTEQSTFDHFALVSLSLERAGLDSPPPNLRSYCLTDCSVADRRAMLRSELARVGEIFAVFLDGVADFVHDPNDPEEAFGFVAELHRLAIEYGCVFVGVLHENPGSSDVGKTRGHLGSQLERKAETNLRLGKADGVSTVYTDRGARHCDIPKDFGTRFQYSAEQQRHVLLASKQDEQAKDKRADLVAFAFSIFEGTSGSLSWAELRNRIKEVGGYADSTARKHIEVMTTLEIIIKDDRHRYSFAG
jgi:hypothetical protein